MKTMIRCSLCSRKTNQGVIRTSDAVFFIDCAECYWSNSDNEIMKKLITEMNIIYEEGK